MTVVKTFIHISSLNFCRRYIFSCRSWCCRYTYLFSSFRDISGGTYWTRNLRHQNICDTCQIVKILIIYFLLEAIKLPMHLSFGNLADIMINLLVAAVKLDRRLYVKMLRYWLIFPTSIIVEDKYFIVDVINLLGLNS